ncbi:hypothetical protein [Antrihabitans stalactiti]|uniref:Uncharacterized protein n=1 Tax=Antrihabitans stalactiti TaxID=2584121 RepID=A0A848K8G2_9NOCA|nr:hypothetical protein [Antrihabitans stalactiti]NMN93688.1 hypothetical protein [Antrihabitans stalactiti]
MRGMKKFGMSLVIAAGIGGGLLSAPVANAAPSNTGTDLSQGSGCFVYSQWYDICPSNHDNDDRDRERRRNRDRRDDHHVEHHN